MGNERNEIQLITIVRHIIVWHNERGNTSRIWNFRNSQRNTIICACYIFHRGCHYIYLICTWWNVRWSFFLICIYIFFFALFSFFSSLSFFLVEIYRNSDGGFVQQVHLEKNCALMGQQSKYTFSVFLLWSHRMIPEQILSPVRSIIQ